MDYLIAIDQGTTSTRAMAVDLQGQEIASKQVEIRQIYPKPGWVEHDPAEILATTIACVRHVITEGDTKGYNTPLSIGITNQRETCLLWDRATGQAFGNAIVWQDRRTSEFCNRLKAAGHEQMVHEKTGLLLDPYFSASKIAWILDQDPSLRKRAIAGELAFGTVDSFLLWHLTGGRHQTDVTNASRTMLMNIHSLSWDDELLAMFDVPHEILPEISENIADFGTTSKGLFDHDIPIGAMIGDQQAAAIGQGCIAEGMSKSTYGTGCFLLHNTGAKPCFSKHKLLTTVAFQVAGEVSYAIEGSIFMAGATLQWLRDGLSIIQSAEQAEELACQIEHNNGVYMVPAFAGMGAPHWDPDARGAIFGITRDTGVCEFVRAALESVVYQTRDLLDAIEGDAGIHKGPLSVDGGVSVNNWLMQFMADILNVDVARPTTIETTAMGAAFLAGMSAGVYMSLSDVQNFYSLDRTFSPHFSDASRKRLLKGWDHAVSRTLTTKDGV